MNLFSFVKNNIKILDVVNEYTTLKKAGGLYWKSPCPFHQEKTPSFTVSPDKDIFYCFGCHVSGDVIGFIAKIENLSQYEAAQFLIEKYNITVPTSIDNATPQSQTSKDEKEAYFHLCKVVAAWCHDQLFHHNDALNYLHSRKFSQQSIQQYSLGYFPKASYSIKQLLALVLKQGFLTQDLIKAGIVFESKNALYSPFENRIIFPIKDHLGRFCGFGGRIFQPQDDRPKYYNSKENSFFQKGQLLFGLDIAKKSIQETKAAFLVEGYTDCIAMHNYGYKNSIATLGTACTLEHLKLLARYTDQFYLLYDSDSAGKKAILRLAQMCWNINVETKVICLPTGMDPASFLMHNKDLKPYIIQAEDIFSFFLQAQGKDYQQKNLKEKIEAAGSIIEVINNLQDPLKQDILLLKASEILQIPLEILRKEYSKNKEEQIPVALQTSTPHVLTRLEQKICSVVLHHPHLITSEIETLLLAGLPQPYNKLLEKVITFFKQNPNSSLSLLQEQLVPEQQQLIHQLLFSFEEENIDQAFEQMLLQFQKKHWKSIVVHIKMELKKATQEADPEKVQKIIKDFQNIKAKLLKSGRL